MWKKILLGLVLVFAALQFVRPPKNLSAAPAGPDDFLQRHKASAEVRQLFAVACYDCHSDHTRYPWYAEIQPLGWWLADHVKDGKAELNLSVFGKYSTRRQGQAIDAMVDVLSDRSMPLKSYTLTHRDAKLTDAQTKTLIDWLETQREELE